MEDYKKLLTDLYTTHDPERINQIDYFLERYKGKESQFYISQKAKYKSRKPISDSKKIIEEALERIKSQSSAESTRKSEAKEKPSVFEDSSVKPEEEIAAVETSLKKEEKTNPLVDEPVNENIATVETGKKSGRTTNEEFYQTPYYYKKKTTAETPKKTVSSPFETNTKDDWQSERKKEPVTRPSTISYQESDKPINKRYFLYIFGIVSLATVLALIAFFFFFISPRTTRSKAKTEKTVSAAAKKENKTSGAKTITTPAKKETKTAPKKTINTEAKPIVVKNDKAIATNESKGVQSKPTTASISGLRIQKGNIQLPVHFVACYAVKSENLALKKINELKSKGFDASYYWIPDFVPDGNTYFKVVIGPFSTRMDAMIKLTPVQERAEFDAYVLELK